MQFLVDELYRETLRGFNQWCRRKAMLVFLHETRILKMRWDPDERGEGKASPELKSGSMEDSDDECKGEGSGHLRRVMQNGDLLKQIVGFI